MTMPVGKWDQALFDDYRGASAGPHKRLLLGKLLQQNMPLIKVLLDQFLQPSGKCKHGPNLLRGGTDGFLDIPWEDGMQMASIAFCKAMDRFNPTKGKLPWYLKLKIRHELQTLVTSGGRMVRVPRGQEGEIVAVELEGEQEVLDRWSGGESDGFGATEDITADDLEKWRVTGEWPESLEEVRAQKAPPQPADARTALERFLDEQVLFRPAGRVARLPLAARWERMTAAPFVSTLRPALLGRGGVREQAVRAPWDGSVVWGFAGLALRDAG